MKPFSDSDEEEELGTLQKTLRGDVTLHFNRIAIQQMITLLQICSNIVNMGLVL